MSSLDFELCLIITFGLFAVHQYALYSEQAIAIQEMSVLAAANQVR